MNRVLKGWSIFIFSIGGIVLLLIVGIVLLFHNFRVSLQPDENEEAKVKSQAEQYLLANYPTMKYEISGVEYDSGSQHDRFDYAALILNIERRNVRIFD